MADEHISTSKDSDVLPGNDISKINPAGTKIGSSNSLIVNPRQRGNPILKSVRNIPWEYGNIVADYVMGQSNCALFLSLRYHQLHPNYIHERLKQLGKSYELRVLLVQVDVKDCHHLLKDLAKICILAECTLILAFSPEEAGRYLETYKIFENKPPEALMEKTEENFMAKFTDCLTQVKSVNKTDCQTLISQFGSLANVMEAGQEDLSLCPGFGPQKAKRLHQIFHEPFLRSQKGT
ncbi:DNA excision repair protein ERCC-1-like [Physella acuta]|uniref:DNA excision repair protein ERCC-1-like n=1 Tax=Physella acuta TaxID=109671 RepID=UPI0027DC27EF|nr:DNA excision repair protein ERCC-1-like [Physella acuta]